MKGLDNQLYVTLLIIANVMAILQWITAVKWPRIAKLSFVALFAWAAWTNWQTVMNEPKVYLEYAELAWIKMYATFINGWFAAHTVAAVGAIATCQALIAVSMLLKGWVFKVGCMGAILFLLAILPLGIGAGFPATAIMAIACFILLRKEIKNEASREMPWLASR